jgi:tryptophan synthase beta chain
MKGHFGVYGGQFVPETLMYPLQELEEAYAAAQRDPSFQSRLDYLFHNYSGRPTPLYNAERLAAAWDCGKDLLETRRSEPYRCTRSTTAWDRDCLRHAWVKRGSLPKRAQGSTAWQQQRCVHCWGWNATSTWGEEDIRRQELNLFRMKLLGARVIPVSSGSRTLKDAINEAMRDWVTNVRTTYYMLGSVLGPHPYPTMVRDFQSVIGREVRGQILEKEGRLPDVLVACVGGGSNAMGLFFTFVPDKNVRMVGAEAGGRGPKLGDHAARFSGGSPGVLHGTFSYILQDEDGQIVPTHSVSAGLDYPSVGPEHATLHDTGRVEYTSISDEEALNAFSELGRLEGIIPALESAHAVARRKN